MTRKAPRVPIKSTFFVQKVHLGHFLVSHYQVKMLFPATPIRWKGCETMTSSWFKKCWGQKIMNFIMRRKVAIFSTVAYVVWWHGTRCSNSSFHQAWSKSRVIQFFNQCIPSGDFNLNQFLKVISSSCPDRKWNGQHRCIRNTATSKILYQNGGFSLLVVD